MTTRIQTIEYLTGQLAGVDGLAIRTMFGEYGIWCDGKTVALICNDQLFVKMTVPGRDFAKGAAEAPAYSGAKPGLLIEADRWEDADWMATLIRITADALPPPRTKRSKAKAVTSQV